MVCYTYIKEHSVVGWLPLFFLKERGRYDEQERFFNSFFASSYFHTCIFTNYSTNIKESHLTHPMI